MLNWQRIQDLKDDLGEEDFEEVVGLFLEEVEEKLDALAESKHDEMVADLHFLKGSAANLGFDKFRITCEQMEREPAQFDASALLSVYQTSKAAYLKGPKP